MEGLAPTVRGGSGMVQTTEEMPRTIALPRGAQPGTASIAARGRGLPWLVGGSAIALSVLAALAVAMIARRPRVAAAVPTVAASPPEPPAPAVAPPLPIPLDVTRLLGTRGGALVMAGEGSLYLAPLDASQPAARIALDGGKRALGAAADGLVFMLDGDALKLRDAVAQSERIVAGPMPAELAIPGEVAISPRGEVIARTGETSVDVYRVSGGRCDKAFSVAHSGGSVVMAVTDARLYLVEGTAEVSVHDTGSGQRAYAAPFPEQRPYTIAPLVGTDLFAVAGWFDRVLVFDAGKPETPPVAIQRQGGTTALAWIPDGPTLAMAGRSGAALWHRDGSVATLTDKPAERLLVSGATLLVTGIHDHAATAMRLPAPPPERKVPVVKGAIWAIVSDAERERLLIGGSDGGLYSYALPDGPAVKHELHSDGVTALAIDAEHIASSSDDKTIAVWKLADTSVVWRSKAHGFLVNALRIAGEPPSLWSSSSDGTLKQWDWPQLEERFQIDTQEIAGKKQSVAAFWISRDGHRILAGTWANALDVIDRDGTSVRGRVLPCSSQALYQAVEVLGGTVVLFSGVEPPGVYAYDLSRDAWHTLPDLGADATCAIGAGDAAYVLGHDVVLRYDFARGGDGRITTSVRAHSVPGAGELQAGVLLDGGLAAGNGDGELVFLDGRVLDGEPMARVTLAP
ncbi:MAG: WD40 repeat domain-containing protein [Acidobacteriota bacterium]